MGSMPETHHAARSAMMTPRIHTYAEFWRFYLREHSRPATRAWHYLGSSLVVLCLISALVTGRYWLFAAMVVVGYAPAWFAHAAVQKNRPATFRHPLWSLISDFRMYGAWLTGRIGTELRKAGIEP
jgi:hypothetical protein